MHAWLVGGNACKTDQMDNHTAGQQLGGFLFLSAGGENPFFHDLRETWLLTVEGPTARGQVSERKG